MGKSRLVFMKRMVTLIIISMLLLLAACTTASNNITLTAEDETFSRKTITVRAGEEVTIVFENKDSVPHNLAVYEDETATTEIFIGEIITVPGTITYTFTAPPYPGVYFFRCDVHPETMTGNFIVAGTIS